MEIKEVLKLAAKTRPKGFYTCPTCGVQTEINWAHAKCIYPALPGQKIVWRDRILAVPDEEC